jgi:hypothetical protein
MRDFCINTFRQHVGILTIRICLRLSHCCSLVSSPGRTTYADDSKGLVIQLSTEATYFNLLHSLQIVSGPTQPRVLCPLPWIHADHWLPFMFFLCAQRRTYIYLFVAKSSVFASAATQYRLFLILRAHRWTPCAYIYAAKPSVLHGDRVMEHITGATAVIRNKALGFNQGCD